MPINAPIKKSNRIIVNKTMTLEGGLNELGWRKLKRIC